MDRRLCAFAAQKLAGQDAEHILRIHAELPLDRVTPILAGWLKKLDPLGHGNPEPVFVARNLQLSSPVRLMKEKHIRLEVTPAPTALSTAATVRLAPMKAVGWNMARRASELSLEQGSVIDLAYRVRENDHPLYGGLQIEIAGMKLHTAGDI